MSIRTKNIIVGIISFLAFYQLMVKHGISPGLLPVSSAIVQLSYSISLAVLTGTIVYALTSGWSWVILNKEREKLIKNELRAFVRYSLGKFELIEKNNFSNGSNSFREKYESLTYGSKCSPKANASNTIYETLTKIKNKRDSLFQTVVPLLQSSNNTRLLKDVYGISNHKLFRSNNKYLTKEENDIKDDTVGIGSFIESFSKDLKAFNGKFNLDAV